MAYTVEVLHEQILNLVSDNSIPWINVPDGHKLLLSNDRSVRFSVLHAETADVNSDNETDSWSGIKVEYLLGGVVNFTSYWKSDYADPVDNKLEHSIERWLKHTMTESEITSYISGDSGTSQDYIWS